jgi:hypothetical protein
MRSQSRDWKEKHESQVEVVPSYAKACTAFSKSTSAAAERSTNKCFGYAVFSWLVIRTNYVFDKRQYKIHIVVILKLLSIVLYNIFAKILK